MSNEKMSADEVLRRDKPSLALLAWRAAGGDA